MNRNLFAALQLEKLALFVIVTIIVLVAAFAIIGHLVLLVAEKRKEIGILKAIGATGASHHRRVLHRGDDDRRGGHPGRERWSGSLSSGCRTPYKIIRLAGDVYQIDHLPMKLTPARLPPDRRRHARPLLLRHDHPRPPRRRARTRRRAAYE